jgi:prevent-host-death family protein
MEISEVNQDLPQVGEAVSRREARIVVEKRGIPVAGIVSIEDLERLDRLDRERTERFRILDEIGEAFRDIPSNEVEREVARALAEVRTERQSEQEREPSART